MNFAAEFSSKIVTYKPDFRVTGFLSVNDTLYPLGSDTKVLSTAFELVIKPIIYEIALEHGLLIREPTKQNFYPDFTLMKDDDDPKKIAVDVKTTYRNFRKDGTWTASFTLGSYTSFLRTETKNIAFPFSDYEKHYIIGFIYSRQPAAGDIHFYSLTDRAQVVSPVKDAAWFVQEKYRIAGERAGSGNTTNIGSIVRSSVEGFAVGDGPFAALGEEVFIDYWRNYGRTKGARAYSNLAEYQEWKKL